MQYLAFPIGAFIEWTLRTFLVPIGELPDLINPNYLFLFLGVAGMFYWLFLQKKYNEEAERKGTLK